MKTFNTLFTVGACVLFASCSTVPSSSRVLLQVTRRFAELKEAGKLPGFAPTDHGELNTQAFPPNHHITYPATVMIYATRQNDPARYAYTFTKETSSYEWRLITASRTLSDGQREDLKME